MAKGDNWRRYVPQQKYGGPHNRERWVREWVVYRRLCGWTWKQIAIEIDVKPDMARKIAREHCGYLP